MSWIAHKAMSDLCSYTNISTFYKNSFRWTVSSVASNAVEKNLFNIIQCFARSNLFVKDALWNDLFSKLGKQIVYYLREVFLSNYCSRNGTSAHSCVHSFIADAMNGGAIVLFLWVIIETSLLRPLWLPLILKDTILTTLDDKYKTSAIAPVLWHMQNC